MKHHESEKLSLLISALLYTIKSNLSKDIQKCILDIKHFLSTININIELPDQTIEHIFHDVFNLSLDLVDNRSLLLSCLNCIQEIYGENHFIIADIYMKLSDSFSSMDMFKEALDFVGESLLIRVNHYGIYHIKTAECHYYLGIIYRYLKEYDKSRQELYICRGIHIKLHGENNIFITTCDLHIGHTESCVSSDLNTPAHLSACITAAIAAYIAYYRCYHTRYVLLGSNHQLTCEADKYVLLSKNIKGERYVSAIELKHCVHELKWLNSDTFTRQYCVSLYINRLEDNIALNSHQVKALVQSAQSFSRSKLDGMIHKGDESLILGASATEDELIQEVDAIASLLFMKPTPVYMVHESLLQTKLNQTLPSNDDILTSSSPLTPLKHKSIVSSPDTNYKPVSISGEVLVEKQEVVREEDIKYRSKESPKESPMKSALKINTTRSSMSPASNKKQSVRMSVPFKQSSSDMSNTSSNELKAEEITSTLTPERKSIRSSSADNPLHLNDDYIESVVHGDIAFNAVSSRDSSVMKATRFSQVSSNNDIDNANYPHTDEAQFLTAAAKIDAVVDSNASYPLPPPPPPLSPSSAMKIKSKLKGPFKILDKKKRSKDQSSSPLASTISSTGSTDSLLQSSVSVPTASSPISKSSSLYLLKSLIDKSNDDGNSNITPPVPFKPPPPPPRRSKYYSGDEDSPSNEENIPQAAAIIKTEIHINQNDSDDIVYDHHDNREELLNNSMSDTNISSSSLLVEGTFTEAADDLLTPMIQEHVNIKDPSSNIFQNESVVETNNNKDVPIIIAEESDHSVPFQRPKNWKPVKYSIYHSIAWSQKSKRIIPVDFTFGSNTENVLYGRDSEGSLLLIQRASSSLLKESLQAKLLALVIFPWLANGKTVHLLNIKQKSNIQKSNRQMSITTTVSPEKKRMSIVQATIMELEQNRKLSLLNAITSDDKLSKDDSNLSSVIPSDNTIEQINKTNEDIIEIQKDDKSDKDGKDDVDEVAMNKAKKDLAKSKLSALFNKNIIPISNMNYINKNKNTIDEETIIIEGPIWADDIHIPPPLPTSWPPIPYNPEDQEEINMKGNADDKNTSGPKLKQLYLTNINIVSEGTLWHDANNNINVSELIDPIDLFNDYEEQFTTDKSLINKIKKPNQIPFDSKINQTNGNVSKDSIKRDESVLDIQRAQNINIMLAKFGKRNYYDLAKAILNFEAERIGYSIISSLAQFIPLIDESNKVQSFILNKYQKYQRKSIRVSIKADENLKDLSTINTIMKRNSIQVKKLTIKDIDMSILQKLKIDKAEQYIFIFSQINHLDIRLSAMICQLTMHETNKKIISSSEIILNAVTEIKGSDRLRFLLKSFLDLNNILAKTSKNSIECTGIKLESLAKLGQTKTNSGVTVEQYVVSKILIHFPDALNISNDLPSINEARIVMFPRLFADLKKIEEGINLMKTIIDADKNNLNLNDSNSKIIINETAVNDQINDNCNIDINRNNEKEINNKSNIEKSLEITSNLYQIASGRLNEAFDDFHDLCKYFGEDNNIEPDQLFGYLILFIKGINNAKKNIELKTKASKSRPARPKIDPSLYTSST